MKTTKLKIGSLLIGAAVLMGTASCKKEGCTDVTATNYSKKAKKDDGSCVYEPKAEENEIRVSSNITSSTTWETGKIYILTSRIAVTNGATLTIQPGVIVKGEAGSGANATALIIARGSKINAVGTATQPIIFTSIADEIKPGQIASPNLEPTMTGLWGGLLVLGSAPISADAETAQIEGIPASDPNGLYGGSNASDNSGVLKYISIRHGGANIGEGNEINGLTLGGVGNSTIIQNIEVIGNQDDGIEIFGGTVNVNNVVIWNVSDDGIDTDQGWAGTLSNFVVLCVPGSNPTDHALEIDGPEGSLMAAHTVQNGTLIGSVDSEIGDFRSGARGTFTNIYSKGFPDPAVAGRGDLTLSGTDSQNNFANGILNFSNLQITEFPGVALSAIFLNGTHVHATSVAAGANTVGATTSVFSTWSWSSVAGKLNF
jgi:hypothetical protein